MSRAIHFLPPAKTGVSVPIRINVRLQVTKSHSMARRLQLARCTAGVLLLQL